MSTSAERAFARDYVHGRPAASQPRETQFPCVGTTGHPWTYADGTRRSGCVGREACDAWREARGLPGGHCLLAPGRTGGAQPGLTRVVEDVRAPEPEEVEA